MNNPIPVKYTKFSDKLITVRFTEPVMLDGVERTEASCEDYEIFMIETVEDRTLLGFLCRRDGIDVVVQYDLVLEVGLTDLELAP
jgi:hypothetical protein